MDSTIHSRLQNLEGNPGFSNSFRIVQFAASFYYNMYFFGLYNMKSIQFKMSFRLYNPEDISRMKIIFQIVQPEIHIIVRGCYEFYNTVYTKKIEKKRKRKILTYTHKSRV